MSMKYYEPKYLRGIIEKTQPPRTYFRSNYFPEVVTFPTPTVSFEFSQSSRVLMDYTPDGISSVPLGRSGYQLRTYRAPLIAGARVITPETLEMKAPGEPEWNSELSAADRERALIAHDIMDLQDALYRKLEYMCARVKQDGKLLIDGDGLSEEVDYGFTNIETVNSSNKWTASYDILGKLTKMARSLRRNGISPDTLIVGQDAAEALNTNEGILSLRHDELLNIPDPSSLDPGITYLCQIRSPGLNLKVYEYDECYTDTDGKLVPLIDPGTVIMQSSRERNIMLHGAVTYIDYRTRSYQSARRETVPYVVVEEDPPVMKLVLASRALPMVRDKDSWMVLKSVV